MLQINERRLMANLTELAEIGQTPEGGVSRPAMSDEDAMARNWFEHKIKSTGLTFHKDGAGNLSAILSSKQENAPTLLIGSHLDSVPNGGRYDGALGVIAALEVALTIQENRIDLPFHLEVISFTDEEGAVLGLLGSRAVAGKITVDDLNHPRCTPEVMAKGFENLGLTADSILSAKRQPKDLLAFLEVHIEQGVRLEKSNTAIGIVTSIVGIRSFWLSFTGEAAHSGTTPMPERKDALWGATAFIQQVKALVIKEFMPGVVNIGQIHVEPGAFNTVPAQAYLSLEFRHGTETQLDEMQNAILSLAQSISVDYGLELKTEPANQVRAALMNEQIIVAIERTSQKLRLTHKQLISFAGHDTQAMSTITPSAMFFVPSVNGTSHHPEELTRPEDCRNAAIVLLHSVLDLAEKSTQIGEL